MQVVTDAEVKASRAFYKFLRLERRDLIHPREEEEEGYEYILSISDKVGEPKIEHNA